MRRVMFALAVLIPIAMLVSAVSFGFIHLKGARASVNSCTQTGFFRDNINLTAAVIPTVSSPNVAGIVNASGCNIGVYYGPGIIGTVSNAEIFGANYFGVVNNGGNVKITTSRIHDIGENPLNGDQHGVGIYFAFGSAAKGSIMTNVIWNYQKGGIVVNGVGTKATISLNTVIGQGPVNYIAQNGIQVGYGAVATVTSNIVTGNSYSGTNFAASGGILVVGGSFYGGALTIGVKITKNILVGNDVGVYLSNLDGVSGIPTLTPTNIIVNHNIITNDGVNNISGYTSTPPIEGYQAGVSDQGDNDRITNNSICGLGYTPVTPPPFLYFIDVTVTNSPTVSGNTSCLDGSPISASVVRSAVHMKKQARVNFVH